MGVCKAVFIHFYISPDEGVCIDLSDFYIKTWFIVSDQRVLQTGIKTGKRLRLDIRSNIEQYL